MIPERQYGQDYSFSASAASSLLSRVSYLLCTCLLATAGAAYFSRAFGGGAWWMFSLCALGCVIGLRYGARIPVLNLVLLYGLSVFEGLALGPLLNMYTYAYANGGQIIAEAFVMTAATVGGIGFYTWITNKDFGYLGKFLFWALIALMVVMIVAMFWHTLQGTTASLAISVVGAAIFVGFTLYDFSNIKHRFGPNDYVVAAVNLYLDFLNLFLFLLRILSILQGGGRSRN